MPTMPRLVKNTACCGFCGVLSPGGGWAIGDREPYSEDQDPLHASAIYYLLENEIVPMFYERREQTPREWVRRMKQSLTYISPNFDCRRMVREYMTELYDPAHCQHLRVQQGNYAPIHEKAAWTSRIREVWDRVRFVESGPGPGASVLNGLPVPVRAAVDLAGLTPEENDADHEALLALAADGALDMAVDVVPIEQAPDAVEAVARGSVQGKMVIAVSQPAG